MAAKFAKTSPNEFHKNAIWVPKNAEFDADFNKSIEKFKRLTRKKLEGQELLHTVLKYTLLYAYMQRIRNQHQTLHFDTHVDFLWENFFNVILALSANFEAKRARNGSTKQKTFVKNVNQNIFHFWVRTIKLLSFCTLYRTMYTEIFLNYIVSIACPFYLGIFLDSYTRKMSGVFLYLPVDEPEGFLWDKL